MAETMTDRCIACASLDRLGGGMCLGCSRRDRDAAAERDRKSAAIIRAWENRPDTTTLERRVAELERVLTRVAELERVLTRVADIGAEGRAEQGCPLCLIHDTVGAYTLTMAIAGEHLPDCWLGAALRKVPSVSTDPETKT